MRDLSAFQPIACDDCGFSLNGVVPEGSQAVAELTFGGGTLSLDGQSITAPVMNDHLRTELAQTGRQSIQVWLVDGK